MYEPERRRSERFTAENIPARLALQPLRLIDLGDTGARVETAAWLAPGRRCVLSIGDAGLQLNARITRARLVRVEPAPDGVRPIFEAGIEFESLSVATRQELGRWMAGLAATARADESPVLLVAAR
jgi:hypothetical protein